MKRIQEKYLKAMKKCKEKQGIMQLFYRYVLYVLSIKTQIQIPYTTKIGDNFSIVHFGRIIINPKTIIGNNVCVNTGVTIGQENRGIREGCPTIGNDVWIGTNAVIVGKVNIGNNVLIAPNAFVNFDVPNDSVVVGNPGIVKHKKNAVKGYLK